MLRTRASRVTHTHTNPHKRTQEHPRASGRSNAVYAYVYRRPLRGSYNANSKVLRPAFTPATHTFVSAVRACPGIPELHLKWRYLETCIGPARSRECENLVASDRRSSSLKKKNVNPRDFFLSLNEKALVENQALPPPHCMILYYNDASKRSAARRFHLDCAK